MKNVAYSLILCVALVAGCSTISNSITGNCNNTQGGENKVCPQSQVSEAAHTPSSGATQHNVAANGTVLNHYKLDLPANYYLPVGPTQPTEADASSNAVGDIQYNDFAGSLSLVPVSGFSSIVSYNGDPTYRQCLDDTDLVAAVSVTPGAGFCLFENQGYLVGGTVLFYNPSEINPSDITIQVTVWENKES
jgi:hypothetical protein